ncbi:hypothetical protein M9H77_25703 [Catharanthus roseus]|uniref:Uncharacterized protein n=1 Tax=Catharanthus roseus TaxID=4058 RepID=A0ACC0A941_CATRO|nr:hypothetical protein M9H77_25703 [Catharanthus roseus]
MDMKRQVEFHVTLKKIENIPLSNLDLLLPPVNPSSVFCYKKPLDEAYTFERMVEILKKSLSKTLASFYALAGEMVQNKDGEPELLCNNRGLDFAEAYADVELIDLNFYSPDECFRGKLVPAGKTGLLAVQVTELKCEGVVVAFTVDHRLTDAYSANMFTLSWVEVAKGNNPLLIPSFGRSSLLSPHHHHHHHHHPGHYDSTVSQLYLPISSLPPPPPADLIHDDELEAISRVYYINADEINNLQLLANKNNSEYKRTKLEAFSGFLWKIIASNNIYKNKVCRLGIVVDGRSRLAGDDEKSAKLMASHYGNVLSIPFGEKKCEELQEKTLNWIANQIHEFLECAVTKAHFHELIDWVEARRPKPAMTKIYTTKVREEGSAVVVSSGQRFPVAKMDFGWGSSAFSSYYFPWGGQSGYVVPMPSPKGNGDWVVYMHLLREQLDYIETCEASRHLFNPLTSTYLNLF